MQLLGWMIASRLMFQEAAEVKPLEPLGWLFLLTSLVFVWGLTGWCFYKVLTIKDDHIVEPPATLGG
jgi:hypothetical protein